MDLRIFFEWSEECGIKLREVYPFRENLEEYFKGRYYGESLTAIGIIVNARGYDVKQRKIYRKNLQRLNYDILLDYFLIKNVSKEEKRKIIKRQFIQITEQVLAKYRFKDFNKGAFLDDLKTVVSRIKW